jgi:uncharacterized RDD family membrane protein YckC
VAFSAPAPVAPLARRAIAFFLDGLILVPAYLIYATVLDAVFGALVAPDPIGSGLVVVAVNPGRVTLELTLTILTDVAYYAGSWATWGMTLGQRTCGVAVRAVGPGAPPPPGAPRRLPPDPERVPTPSATVRWAVLQLLPLCISTLGAAGALSLGVVASVNGGWYAVLLVSAIVDPLRRGLHDRAAGTVVVRPSVRGRI